MKDHLLTWLGAQRSILRVLLPLVIVLVIGSAFHSNGAFFAWETHRAVLREVSVHGILACGMTLVVVAGGIDLAVGSVLALGAVSIALLTMQRGWPAPLAVGAVLAMGAACGATSGTLVAFFRAPAFVASLAMLVFARGLAKLCADGKKVTTHFVGPDGLDRTVPLPALFEGLDDRVIGGQLSVVTLVFVACAGVTWLLLSRMRIGRYLYATGGNLEAARLSGVPVRTAVILAFVFSGVFSAIAGICQAAQETHGDPETGMGYELDAIAMVVLGGASLTGGRGNMGGTLVGVLTVGYLQKVLSLNAFSLEARLMLTGAILVAAVLLQSRAMRGTEG
ncbi:MAG: ABC transporter permease [Polyangiaceae bacterium]|nr:ABC transporter permease [Polyangiaceae bacterium]